MRELLEMKNQRNIQQLIELMCIHLKGVNLKITYICVVHDVKPNDINNYDNTR